MNKAQTSTTPPFNEDGEDVKISIRTKKKKKFAKPLIYLSIFIITGLAVFTSQVLVSEQSSSSWLYNLPLVKQIRHLAESADRNLKGEDRERINMLLLGMGGSRHEGGYLTDTIMIASLDIKTKKIALISIPRDLAVPAEDRGWIKINHINAYAEAEAQNSGGLAISQAVSDVFAIPIDYYIRLDFDGFVNIVDELGGLNVQVENTLDDYSYPVMGMEEAEPYEARYEHLHVEEGWQKMDGDLALKFARSRHGIRGEGSDFARAKRQQKILEAAKNKILSMSVLFKPKMISDIISQYNEHVSTNLKIWEIIKLWDLFKDVDKEHIINKVIDNGPNGLLTESISEKGAYILSPRSGDFAEIQYFINSIFSDAPEEDKIMVSDERATVEVRNGTWINGLASKTALDIEKYGFIVVRIGNSTRQNFEKSVIYDLTYGEKMESLTILKNKTNANISFSLPDWLVEEISNELENEKSPIQPDFILVIGRDADITESGIENTENEM
ncbi:hypothetical protein DRH27_00935 [Candidatus Falkowbacteria bacterium]|nr:MAG: hypothetical protein DRH27_00935 [Candidatus Falkowbacteria bacterium]